jgi:hypothetical protein
MKANKVISFITAGLVLFLAGAAFVLSYEALRDLAEHNGIRADLAWLWPLMLDAVMIAASLSVLRANLYAERSWYPWGLVGVFTLASIAFNVVHANATLTARAVALLPPAVVFLAFELLMGQIKATVKRSGATLSLADLLQQAQEAGARVAGLGDEVATLTAKRDALRADLLTLRKERATYTAVSDDTRAQAAAILAQRCDISGAELGRLLGKSGTLGRKLKAELMPVAAGGNGRG